MQDPPGNTRKQSPTGQRELPRCSSDGGTWGFSHHCLFRSTWIFCGKHVSGDREGTEFSKPSETYDLKFTVGIAVGVKVRKGKVRARENMNVKYSNFKCLDFSAILAFISSMCFFHLSFAHFAYLSCTVALLLSCSYLYTALCYSNGPIPYYCLV